LDDTFFDHLSAATGVRHCITRRDPDKPSEGSLALHTGDDPHAVLRNRAAIREHLGQPRACISPLQVHGNTVHIVTHAVDRGWDELDRTFEADALITDLPGVVLTILTADCVPILIFDPIRRVVGAVHAGWRGTHAHIVTRTLTAMQETYGSQPHDLLVGLGPAIGECCYEVDTEVADKFADYPDTLTPKGEGKYLLDTRAVNHRQLIAAGVPASRIESSSHCTMCRRDRYFSYRADRTTGRFMSCIMLEEI
jgi:YfiH family protein